MSFAEESSEVSVSNSSSYETSREGDRNTMNSIYQRFTTSRLTAAALFALVILFAAREPGSAQWTTSGNDIFNSNTGNVGIGMPPPLGAKLDIAGSLRTKASGPLFTMFDDAGTADARQFYFWNSGGVIHGS